jgi:uncharacterized RDD family membrane protein YckC
MARMITNNNITWKQRLVELFIDYVFILAYLIFLFGVTMGAYFGILGHIPELNELQSQLIATCTSVIPLILIFSFLDYRQGSFGKKKAKLKLFYSKKSFGASLLRNFIKLLPWQLAHIGVIHGMYSDFDLPAVILTNTSMLFAITLLIMGFARKDRRHLGDLLAGTQVQVKS